MCQGRTMRERVVSGVRAARVIVYIIIIIFTIIDDGLCHRTVCSTSLVISN